MNSHNTPPTLQDRRRIVLLSVWYKAALTAGLLLVALVFSLLATPTTRDGAELRGQVNQSEERTGDKSCAQLGLMKASASSGDFSVQPAEVACPRSLPSPNVSVYPKISPAELYVRLLEEGRVKWTEPARLPGN